MFIVICIVLIALVLILFVQSQRNHAIVFEEAIHTAESDIKVQEKRRMDLIYNLVDCVKEYDEHEASVLTDLAGKMASNSEQSYSDLKAELDATAYNYPELKSSQVYIQLMNELSLTENMIASHRENYNGAVNDYERFTKMFPGRVVLPISGYQMKSFKRLDFNAPVDAPQNLFGRRSS